MDRAWQRQPVGSSLQGHQVAQEGALGRGIILGSREAPGRPCGEWLLRVNRLACLISESLRLTSPLPSLPTTLQPLRALPLGTAAGPEARMYAC